MQTVWPVHQPLSRDSNGSDYTDQDGDYRCSTNITSHNCDIEGEDEVDKAPRCRVKFPCSSESNSSPTKSRSNGHGSIVCEHSHHKPIKQSTTQASHQGDKKVI